MEISVIGTGSVGQALATKLYKLGHAVYIGTRNVSETHNKTATNAWGIPGIGSWIKEHPEIELLPFRQAVEKGEDLMILAVSGQVALQCLSDIGEDMLKGRTMIDVTNPLDFSNGFPPTLTICNTESLGEKIQEAYPELKVVKALNTITSPIMGHPELIDGDHNLIICGNEKEAKKQVTELLVNFGWREHNIIDLGDITSARGTEMLMPLFLRLFGKFENPFFNIHIKQTHPISV